MPSLDGAVTLLSHYGYYILFPLAIVEGPIITVIAAFLASQGYLNVFIIYLVVVLADALGDSLLYALGRFHAPFVRKYGRYIGVTEERLKKAESYYEKHHHKSLILSKTIHGIGVSGLVTSGVLRVKYWKYFRTCLIVSLIQSGVFVIVGYFLGHAYGAIATYLNYFAAIGLVVVAAALIIFFLYRKEK